MTSRGGSLTQCVAESGEGMSDENDKSRAELEAELKLLRHEHWYKVFVAVWSGLVKLGLVFIPCLFIFLSAKEFAGKVTGFDFVLNLLADASINDGLAWLVALFSSGLFLRERKIRKATIAREHSRTQRLESIVDENRAGSGLPLLGNTNKEDE